MSLLRPLGTTGLQVSAIGFGTVKLGRNQQVKYPSGFALPDDARVEALLQIARDAGVNLLDTAPAYGSSEERLGKLLQQRAGRTRTIITSRRARYQLFENPSMNIR